MAVLLNSKDTKNQNNHEHSNKIIIIYWGSEGDTVYRMYLEISVWGRSREIRVLL